MQLDFYYCQLLVISLLREKGGREADVRRESRMNCVRWRFHGPFALLFLLIQIESHLTLQYIDIKQPDTSPTRQPLNQAEREAGELKFAAAPSKLLPVVVEKVSSSSRENRRKEIVVTGEETRSYKQQATLMIQQKVNSNKRNKEQVRSGKSSNLVKLDRISSPTNSTWIPTAQLRLPLPEPELHNRETRNFTRATRSTRSLSDFALSTMSKSQTSRQYSSSQRASAVRSSDLTEESKNLVRGVIGERISIPCTNLSTTSEQQPTDIPFAHHNNADSTRRRERNCPNSQSISLIVWYKDGQLDSPVFSADAREATTLRESRQQTGNEQLKSRARLEEFQRFDTESGKTTFTTPVLIIEVATSEDAGLYTCTIEFCKAPTQTHQIRLQLIHPPRDLSIRDNNNQVANGTLIGPYDEHSHLTLTCDLQTAGDPPAQVDWWKLKSVSSLLPSSSSSSSIILPEHPEITEYLTTLEVVSPQVDDFNERRTFNYFVALQPAGHELNLMKLPFTNGQRLKHWTRLPSRVVNKSANAGIKSIIEIGSLTRVNLGEEFICLARNNNFSSPLNGSVEINMNLNPTEVRLVNKQNYVFKLNQKTTIECQVFGSKPTAEISWFRGNQVLNLVNSKHKTPIAGDENDESEDKILDYTSEFNRDINSNNMTKISYLTLIPQMSDNQQSLTCSAHNPAIPNSIPIKDSMTMNVLFPAQMKLQYGSGIKPESIRLGSDVFMDCIIQSNPPINDINWLFNDQPINITTGIIISKLSLVIQHIRIQHRGQYQCVGQNMLGKFYSNKLNLKPQFEPVCDYTSTKTRYVIAVNQETRIDCNVLAEPDNEINFEWKFNQTLDESGGEDYLAPNHLENLEQFEKNFTKSTVIFKPTSVLYQGQLLCSASNLVDRQKKPCVIEVIVTELPEPVFSCFDSNQTESSVSIHCQSSSGSSTSRQTYLLELHPSDSNLSDLHSDIITVLPTSTSAKHRKESSSGLEDEMETSNSQTQSSGIRKHHLQHPIKKLTSNSPTFYIENLEPGTTYNAVLYAQNSKGLSVPVFHQTSTLTSSESSLRSLTSSVQVERNASQETKLSDRFMAYLRSGDYLKDGYSKPVGIALIVILSSVLIVILAFFVTRLCRSPAEEKQERKKRKQQASRSGIVSLEKSVDGGKKMDPNDKSGSQVEKSVHLALATPLRLKGLAGSGSDTSRETNTDSTLISLYRYGTIKGPSHDQLQRESGNEQVSLTNSTAAHVHQPQTSQTNSLCRTAYKQNYSTNFTPSPVIFKQPSDEMRQVNVHTLTCRQMMSSPNEFDHQVTPQVSIQSDSDCTSANELQADHSEFHDRFLIRYHNDLSEPIYVIGTNAIQQQANSPQLCLINPASLYPHSDAIDYGDGGLKSNGNTQGSISLGGTNSYDITQSSSNYLNSINVDINSQALGGNQQSTRNNELQLPLGYLANSASIPVSLSECPHSLRLQQRGTSHEYLNQDLCLNSSNNPYLTLR